MLCVWKIFVRGKSLDQVLPVRAAMCLERFKEWERAVSPQAAAQKKNYPASAVRRYFFTRRSGRAETCGRLLPSPGDQRSGA